MSEYRISRNGRKDLVFEGEILATVNDHSFNSWGRERWDEYTLYKSKNGKFIVQHAYITFYQGEDNIHEAWVSNTAEKALQRAGSDEIEVPRLIKELAGAAGIDFSEHID